MKISSEYIMRRVAGEQVIVPTGTAATNFNGLITVNEIGAFLWEKLQRGITREALLQEVLEAYEVDEGTAERDVDAFLQKLEEAGILQ